MHFASLTGVLQFILILLLVYYGLKILTRLLGPLLLRYVTKKAGQKFEQHFKQYQPPASSTEGEVSIDKKTTKKSTNKDVGEYIDFEEID